MLRKRTSSSFHSLVAIAFVGLVLTASVVAQSYTADRSWDVVFMTIPSSIRAQNFEDEAVGYVLTQTHRPLLYKDHNGNYASEVLLSWSKNIATGTFAFCPNTALEFRPGIAFSTTHLERHFRRVLRSQVDSYVIEAKESCVLLWTNLEDKTFLDLLTSMDHAPVLVDSSLKFEHGLGDFYITRINPNHVELARKKQSGSGFTRITLHKYVNEQALKELNQQVGIEDLNRIPQYLVPRGLRQGMGRYTVNVLQTHVLLINHPDPAIRQALYNCVNIGKLRSILNGGEEGAFANVSTILPLGVRGARGDLPKQECRRNSRHEGLPSLERLTHLNWAPGLGESFQNYWDALGRDLGLDIITRSSLSHPGHQPFSTTQYDLLIVKLSSNQFDYQDFYKVVADSKQGLLRRSKISLAQAWRQLQLASSPAQVDAAVERLNGTLRKHHLALPLGQTIQDHFYPINLRGLQFGAGFAEYPRVGGISL